MEFKFEKLFTIKNDILKLSICLWEKGTFRLESKTVDKIHYFLLWTEASVTLGPRHQPWCQGWLEELWVSLQFTITVWCNTEIQNVHTSGLITYFINVHHGSFKGISILKGVLEKYHEETKYKTYYP